MKIDRTHQPSNAIVTIIVLNNDVFPAKIVQHTASKGKKNTYLVIDSTHTVSKRENDRIMSIPCRLIVQSNNYSLLKNVPKIKIRLVVDK